MNLNKGTTVCPSQLGQYNFHYPSENNFYVLDINIEVEPLPWISISGFIAVKVVSPVDYLPYKILWTRPPV
jgi:hypothetical protein